MTAGYLRYPLVAILALLLGAALPTFSFASDVPASVASPLIVGVGAHIMGSASEADKSLDLISAAKISSVRLDAPWSRIEQKKGNFLIPPLWDQVVNSALKRKISVLLILDYGNPLYDHGDKPTSADAILAFANYAKYVVNHFKGRVTSYEIWNEWDARTGNTTPGSAADYMNLVSKVYPAIKSVDESVLVLVGSVTSPGVDKGFLSQIVEMGALKKSDGLSIHTYMHCRKQPDAVGWNVWIGRVEDGLVKETGGAVPLYVTEMGWPSFSGACGIDEITQAKYLTQLYSMARKLSYIKGVWWYDLRDDGADEANREFHFGLLRWNYAPKPSYQALSKINGS